MKNILKTLAALMLLTAGNHANSLKAQEDTLIHTFTENIMRIRDEMLTVCDTTSNFIFSGDTELADADPHVYWLMSRMMETMRMIRSADDGIEWALAINENVKEYSRRIDRKIYEEDAEDAAATAITHLMNIYRSGNQPEMNTASYVNAIVAIYRTTNEYIRLMKIYRDEQFGNALDFEQIFLMNSLYDVAFHKWLTVREEIAACLGSEQQKTYRELTMRVMSRLYNDLKGLKEIRY